jgi:protein-tyrosine phosphatase
VSGGASDGGTTPPDRRWDPDDIAEIHVVCTGNIARSPFAALLLEDEARRRLDDDAPVLVTSSGIHGLDGRGAVREMVLEAEDRGLDLNGHIAAAAESVTIRSADLILGMTERHREAIVRLAPVAEPRTFTLKELARLLEHVEIPEVDHPRERVREVARAASAARSRVPAPRRPENVADPYGAARDVYRECAAEIEDLVGRISPRLFGSE